MRKNIQRNIFFLLLEVRFFIEFKCKVLSLGHPVVPKIEGHEHIITSDDAFFLEKLPKKVIIVGKIFLLILRLKLSIFRWWIYCH